MAKCQRMLLFSFPLVFASDYRSPFPADFGEAAAFGGRVFLGIFVVFLVFIFISGVEAPTKRKTRNAANK